MLHFVVAKSLLSMYIDIARARELIPEALDSFAPEIAAQFEGSEEAGRNALFAAVKSIQGVS